MGPISGFVFCLLGAFWVARRLSDSHIANGLALGIVAAALDVGILIAIGAPFKGSGANKISTTIYGGFWFWREVGDADPGRSFWPLLQ